MGGKRLWVIQEITKTIKTLEIIKILVVVEILEIIIIKILEAIIIKAQEVTAIIEKISFEYKKRKDGFISFLFYFVDDAYSLLLTFRLINAYRFVW